MSTIAAGRVGRPRSFEPDALIACALSLGPDRLGLRALADELGVPRTTIYNSVRSTDDVGRMVLQSLIAGGYDDSWETLEHASWRAWLETFAGRTRAMLLGAGPWLRFWDPDLSTPALRSAERVANHMVRDGCSPALAVRALSLVNAVVQSSVTWHIQNVWSGDRPREEVTVDEYPILVAGTPAQTIEQEELEFCWNLGCTIAGIEQIAEQTP